MNGTLAVVAWFLARDYRAPTGEGGSAASRAGERFTIAGSLRAAAFLSGLGSLALQMVWARQAALLVGGTTYAFTAVLGVFLLGIGAGSLAFAPWGRAARGSGASSGPSLAS